MIVALYLKRIYYKQYSKFMHAEESDGSITWLYNMGLLLNDCWVSILKFFMPEPSGSAFVSITVYAVTIFC
jgi:hypothetical protein